MGAVSVLFVGPEAGLRDRLLHAIRATCTWVYEANDAYEATALLAGTLVDCVVVADSAATDRYASSLRHWMSVRLGFRDIPLIVASDDAPELQRRLGELFPAVAC